MFQKLKYFFYFYTRFASRLAAEKKFHTQNKLYLIVAKSFYSFNNKKKVDYFNWHYTEKKKRKTRWLIWLVKTKREK